MKKMLYQLSLLAVLSSLVSPAMAATDPTRAAPGPDRAFLAFLSTFQTPAPMAAASKRPPGGGFSEMALCTASASCSDGSSRSCEDNTSPANCTGVDSNCSVGQQGYVSCDGVTTWCPDCCPAGWCDGEAACAASCAHCPYEYTCNPAFCADDCRCRFDICPP